MRTTETSRGTGRSRSAFIESLERRTLLSIVEWIGGAAGNWNDPANWSGGNVPVFNDDVRIIGTTFPTEVTLDSDDHAINSLTMEYSTLNVSGGTLAITNSLTGGSLKMSGGELTINDSLMWASLDMSGGAVTITNGGMSGGALVLTDGILTTTTNPTTHLYLTGAAGFDMSGGTLKGNVLMDNGTLMYWTGGVMASPGTTRAQGFSHPGSQIGGPPGHTPSLSRPLLWYGRNLTIRGSIVFYNATLEYDNQALGSYPLGLVSASILNGGGTNMLRVNAEAFVTGDNSIQVPVELGWARLGGYSGTPAILRLLAGGSAAQIYGSGELHVRGPGFQFERFGSAGPFNGDVRLDSGASTIGGGEIAGGVIVQGADTQLTFTGEIGIGGFLSGSGKVVFDGGAATVTGYTIIPRLQVLNGAVASFGGVGGFGSYLDVDELAEVIGPGSLMQLNNIDANIAALNIGAGAQMRMIGNGSNVLRTGSLTVEGNGFLDLRRESLILDYDATSPLPDVRSYLTSGYNAGAWNGSGIQSSFATGAGLAIGYAEASALFSSFPATFAGQEVDDTTVLLTTTLYGDANLDRHVNLRDFNRLAANFGSGSVWSQGNFNYDATISLLDFGLLAGQFGEEFDLDQL